MSVANGITQFAEGEPKRRKCIYQTTKLKIFLDRGRKSAEEILSRKERKGRKESIGVALAAEASKNLRTCLALRPAGSRTYCPQK